MSAEESICPWCGKPDTDHERGPELWGFPMILCESAPTTGDYRFLAWPAHEGDAA